MKIAVDTNVILRILLNDDAQQAAAAWKLVESAKTIVITIPALCEVVWNLLASKKMSKAEIADVLEAMANMNKIQVHRATVDLGIAILRAGGDFADAVIAHEGFAAGSDVFATFDKKAATLLQQYGHLPVRLL